MAAHTSYLHTLTTPALHPPASSAHQKRPTQTKQTRLRVLRGLASVAGHRARFERSGAPLRALCSLSLLSSSAPVAPRTERTSPLLLPHTYKATRHSSGRASHDTRTAAVLRSHTAHPLGELLLLELLEQVLLLAGEGLGDLDVDLDVVRPLHVDVVQLGRALALDPSWSSARPPGP